MAAACRQQHEVKMQLNIYSQWLPFCRWHFHFFIWKFHIFIQIAWRHQAITWTNVDLSSVRSSSIHLRAISYEIPQPPFTKISLEITYLKLNWNLPGANELRVNAYLLLVALLLLPVESCLVTTLSLLLHIWPVIVCVPWCLIVSLVIPPWFLLVMLLLLLLLMMMVWPLGLHHSLWGLWFDNSSRLWCVAGFLLFPSFPVADVDQRTTGHTIASPCTPTDRQTAHELLIEQNCVECVLLLLSCERWTKTRSQVKVKATNWKKKIAPKIQILKFCKRLCMRHTFWICLIACINMKWIQPEL